LVFKPLGLKTSIISYPVTYFLSQVAALGVICNIVVNLTPRKPVLLHSGVVTQLVHLSKSMNPTLRLKSVWPLRNIMFLLSPKDKDFTMKELTLSTLSSLIYGKPKA
jgi:armadillo repeat-containing protein 8